MSRLGFFSLTLLLIFGVAALTARWFGMPSGVATAQEFDASAAAGAAEGQSAAERGPIVVELFTSQGCSSCPPADRLLSQLDTAESAAQGGSDEIIALAYHVDYWNYIGWQDPFSSKEWSRRQEGYARSLRAGRLYTPQLVVDGREHCVGSQAGEVNSLLSQARRRPQTARVDVEAEFSGTGTLEVAVSARATKGNSRPLDLMLAVVENGLETAITRGENAKRSLRNDHVVRDLRNLGRVESGAVSGTEQQLTVELEAAWNSEHLAVVAFLQDPKTLEVHGADKHPL